MQPNDIPLLAKVVSEAIKKATAPLHAEIAGLKARQPERGEKGEPGAEGKPGPAGKDATVDIEAIVVRAASLIPLPKDGQDAPPVDLDALAVKAAALIPTPKDGRDGNDAVVDLDALALKAAELIPTPKDGEKGDQGFSIVGPEGPQGERGASIACGSGEPAQIGKYGDLYLDIETGMIYECA